MNSAIVPRRNARARLPRRLGTAVSLPVTAYPARRASDRTEGRILATPERRCWAILRTLTGTEGGISLLPFRAFFW